MIRLIEEMRRRKSVRKRKQYRLVDERTLAELHVGSVVSTQGGGRVCIAGLRPPRGTDKRGSVMTRQAGRRASDATVTEYYPSAVGARYEEKRS